MCQQLTCVTKLNERRCVATCEHGTIHVYWDSFGLFLTPKQLTALASCLQRKLLYEKIPRPAVYMRLWSVDLGLPTAEFYRFADMILLAAAQLSQPQRPPVRTTKQPIHFDQLPTPLFSLN